MTLSTHTGWYDDDMELIEVTDNDKIKYYAVNEETAENMINGADALEFAVNNKINYKCRSLGKINVQIQSYWNT